MAARKVGQLAVDWAAIGAKFPQAIKADFNAFRARHEAIKARGAHFKEIGSKGAEVQEESLVGAYVTDRHCFGALSEKPVSIDWDYYKKHISKPGFVDLFQNKFNAVKVPYPEDTQSAVIQQKEKEIEEETKAVLAAAKEEVAKLKGELAKIHAQKGFEEMTVDEYLADKPELRKQIDDDIKNYRWY